MKKSLLLSFLCLSLSLSACQAGGSLSSPQPVPNPIESTGITLQPVPNPIESTGITPQPKGPQTLVSEIAPLPKGPRPAEATYAPRFGELDLSGGRTIAGDGSLVSPGVGGDIASGGGGGGAGAPAPAATSDISVVERTTLTGKVYNSENKAQQGVTVTLRSLNSDIPYESSTTTNESGSYAFNNMPSGVQMEIIVSQGELRKRRVEVTRNNKEGDPNKNRFDFGNDGSSMTFGPDETAIDAPGGDIPEPTPVPTITPTPIMPPAPDFPFPEPEPTFDPQAPLPEAGLLTAGTWRDLDHWNDWLNLLQTDRWIQMMTYWQLSPVYRVALQLTAEQAPVVDQALKIKDRHGEVLAEARSDNKGFVDFFPGLLKAADGPFVVESAQGQQLAELAPSPERYTVELKESQPSANAVDMMLMIDTTGSMGDELNYLKVEMKNVIDQVKSQDQQLEMRLSANFYRDQGDAYVVRDFPFTQDVSQVQNQLLQQFANGGGDFPEAVTDALENAVNEHQWSTSARARLLFLVLDAPPHRNAVQIKRLQAVLPRMQKMGIKLIPVASSGVDKETEFLMRMLAMTTGGEYVFLTDDSGIGGEHIEPTIGDHEVEKLNALMVKIIRKYTE